ncbi:MAG TPA: lipase maturation factor family protein [Candidatus Binatia bacterium]|nr:lipase maturation factor family protein [Candidatus Binatia bacterium]
MQLDVLVGRNGLLPAHDYLRAPRGFWTAPTIFWLDHRDGTLHAAAIVGAILSCGLLLNVAPRWCLVALWALYLSFVTIGQDFLSFQWDNLLLESALFALFIVPGGLRPRRAPPPSRLGVFVMLWLVFRLNFESGLAKLLWGDPTWRDLTAMVSYYETAPIPTWIAWWAHQMPVWAHRATAGFVYVTELGLPLLIWGSPQARLVAFIGMEAMQVGVALTANYGFFNYLSAALLLFLLDDRQLGREPSAVEVPRARAGHVVVAAAVVALTVVSFLPVVPAARALDRAVFPVYRAIAPFRSLNAYHLFAHMTLVRREPVIEGSADGVTWLPYELRYEPGDVDRPPPFVAPHQPRVDFQAWFLLLGPRGAPWFDSLLHRLVTAPETVAGLFARDPFPTTPPRFVRVAVYRYRFTDTATRRATGAWWSRELLGHLPANR